MSKIFSPSAFRGWLFLRDEKMKKRIDVVTPEDIKQMIKESGLSVVKAVNLVDPAIVIKRTEPKTGIVSVDDLAERLEQLKLRMRETDLKQMGSNRSVSDVISIAFQPAFRDAENRIAITAITECFDGVIKLIQELGPNVQYKDASGNHGILPPEKLWANQLLTISHFVDFVLYDETTSDGVQMTPNVTLQSILNFPWGMFSGLIETLRTVHFNVMKKRVAKAMFGAMGIKS